MKNFTVKKLLHIMTILLMAGCCALLDAQGSRTMFFCCSPGGYCGIKAFDSRTTCMQACGGTNRCEARAVNIAPVVPTPGAPVTTPVATPVAPINTGIVTGTSASLTPIVAAGTAVPVTVATTPVAATTQQVVVPTSARRAVSTVIRGR